MNARYFITNRNKRFYYIVSLFVHIRKDLLSSYYPNCDCKDTDSIVCKVSYAMKTFIYIDVM